MKNPRATDSLLAHAQEDGFIIRKSTLVLQIFAMFSIAFLIIFLSASIMNDIGGKIFFLVILGVIIGLLGWFTGVYITRHRDLVIATEFMNAMLASAAQLSTRFCLITRRDGSIVYNDSGFQQLFPTFMQRSRRNIDAFMTEVGLPREVSQRISSSLQHNHNDRVVLTLQDASGKSIQLMVTIDVLARPRGYFLFRGRDYVENRNAKRNEVELAQASLLAQALYTLPVGVAIATGAGKVAYANRFLEEVLGYGLGELLSLSMEQICSQYGGTPAKGRAMEDYTGEVTLNHKNGKPIRAEMQQTLLREGNTVIGVSALLMPADGSHA